MKQTPDPIPKQPAQIDWDKLERTHFVSDGERISIDRRRFKMTRDPESNENVEIINIEALPKGQG